MGTAENFILLNYRKPSVEDLIDSSDKFYLMMEKRRSVRSFSEQEVSKKVIENIIKTASSAPSGAHKQPWTFCAVSSPSIKREIRRAAEKEEKISYESRMSKEWLDDLRPLNTNWQKPFLEIAPWLIIIFKKVYDLSDDGKKSNYYVNESVGIACGFLITAIHQAGLVSLTHTPSPMNFLTEILKRPANERPFLLLPVGYPEPNCKVPALKRKDIQAIAEFYE